MGNTDSNQVSEDDFKSKCSTYLNWIYENLHKNWVSFPYTTVCVNITVWYKKKAAIGGANSPLRSLYTITEEDEVVKRTIQIWSIFMSVAWNYT